MSDLDREAFRFAQANQIPMEDAVAIILSVADALTEREEH